MPLHEYRCRGCAHQFEALVRGGDTVVCPSCRGQDLEQLLSLFAVSSETTRKSNLAAAKRKQAKTARDKAIADAEHEASEHDH